MKERLSLVITNILIIRFKKIKQVDIVLQVRKTSEKVARI